MRHTPQKSAKKIKKNASWEKKAIQFWNKRGIDVLNGGAATGKARCRTGVCNVWL
jgi:hypothetical protein